MIVHSKLAAAAVIAAALLSAGSALARPVGLEADVRVRAGVLHGAPRDDRGVLAFKGIPFAAPPVGDLRWRAPRRESAWTGVRDATRFGPRCLSALENDLAPGPARSEDCLTLNLWTAALAPDEKRPVMVWVHGGGFQFGSSATDSFDGARLAQKGAVVVTINYRLGVLGFLAHPDLDREGPSGDYGLQDQLAALRWVKANIARFGGDPGNVTLFGESAGAHAVGILMASPLSKGMFHKAIGESGAFWDSPNGPLESFDEARSRGQAFARRMGAPSIAALRGMPAEKLSAAATWNFDRNPQVAAFSPNIDRFVVPGVPAAQFARGRQLHIPLLAGWNAVEQFPFGAFALPHATARQFRQAAEGRFGKAGMAEFLSLYPAGSDAEAKASAEALNGDMVIAEQTWQWLELQRRVGGAPVYGYRFSYTSPYVPIAAHTVETPFVFGTLTPQFIVGGRAPPSEADHALSDMILSYWVNFAARGDPNGEGLPYWPAYDAKGMVQAFGTSVGSQVNPQADRFRFLAKYRAAGILPRGWRR